MKVKIIKCSDNMMWYRDKVGQVIQVERETVDWYWAREGGSFNCLNIVDKADVEIVGKTKE